MKIITRGYFFIGSELHYQSITNEYCGITEQEVVPCLSAWLGGMRTARLEGQEVVDYQLLRKKVITAMQNGKGRDARYAVVAKLAPKYTLKNGKDTFEKKVEISVMLSSYTY